MNQLSKGKETGVHDLSAGAHSRAVRRSDDGTAFIPDPYDVSGRTLDDEDVAGDFAEELGQEFVTGATANVDITEQELDRLQESDFGGPFTVTTENEELALDIDPSNPVDATREPFPTAMRGNGTPPPKRRD